MIFFLKKKDSEEEEGHLQAHVMVLDESVRHQNRAWGTIPFFLCKLKDMASAISNPGRGRAQTKRPFVAYYVCLTPHAHICMRCHGHGPWTTIHWNWNARTLLFLWATLSLLGLFCFCELLSLSHTHTIQLNSVQFGPGSNFGLIKVQQRLCWENNTDVTAHMYLAQFMGSFL